tara:strand:- start:7291 stop:7620 length:330 start_codon:yes stop_codon:yes gene_type:complete
MFEKKTRSVISIILDALPKLKYYIVESRGSRGKADIIVGLYNSRNGQRNWIGIQCKKGYISMAEQKRQINSAMKDNGMIMFFALSNEERSEPVRFFPSIKEYILSWINT